MSEYSNKLSAIADKKKKLLEEESRLIEKRKKEIGILAEKFDLLTVSDAVMTGLFLEAQTALKDKSDKVKAWENQGAELTQPKRVATNGRKNTQAAEVSTN